MIDQQTVEKLAELARIKVTKEEAKKLEGELGEILAYVGALERVDTSKVSQATGTGLLKNVWREDVLGEKGDREAILKNAPMREGDAFAVKKVIDYGN